MPVRRAKHTTPETIVDANDQTIEVGGHCGLYIDLGPHDAAPSVGDWIATPAGSRYLVDSVRVVRRRRPARVIRYQLQTLRLPKYTPRPGRRPGDLVDLVPEGAQLMPTVPGRYVCLREGLR